MGDTQWTLCGRYADTIKGSMNIMASDKAHDVNCKACRSQIDESGTEEEE